MSWESNNRQESIPRNSEGGLEATRRQMMLGVCTGVLMMAVGGPAGASGAARPRASAAVLSFHRDEPWLDATGRSAPWHPPRGRRAVETLSDEKLRRIDCYV